MKVIRRVTLTLLAAGAVALQLAQAQAPGITRSELVRRDLGAPGREAIQVRVDFSPGASSGNHFHPGEELAYVLEGTLEYRLAGGPPTTLRAGQALFIPAGMVHSARNVGTNNAAELATYIVKKGKPLVVVVE